MLNAGLITREQAVSKLMPGYGGELPNLNDME
jgi:hypothetical protein